MAQCCKCNKVQQNIDTGLWFHYGTGIYKTLSPFKNNQIINTEDFFNFEILDNIELGVSNKPYGSIYFSGLSWVFDPYNEDIAHQHNIVDTVSVIEMTNFSKIYMIKSLKDLDIFISKYGENQSINWKNVKSDGYYGISIHFRNVSDIFNPKYSWHNGWDVETLAVWDSRGLDKVLIHRIISDDYFSSF